MSTYAMVVAVEAPDANTAHDLQHENWWELVRFVGEPWDVRDTAEFDTADILHQRPREPISGANAPATFSNGEFVQGRATPNVDDKFILNQIARTMDGEEWDGDTLDQIATFVRMTGRTIGEPR